MRVRVDGKTILEHRYIMSKVLGRELKRNEIVHHKDGDPTNNNVGNLEIMTHKEHNNHHNSISHIICICDNCDTEYGLLPGLVRWKKNNNEKFFCSRRCIGLYNFPSKKKGM